MDGRGRGEYKSSFCDGGGERFRSLFTCRPTVRYRRSTHVGFARATSKTSRPRAMVKHDGPSYRPWRLFISDYSRVQYTFGTRWLAWAVSPGPWPRLRETRPVEFHPFGCSCGFRVLTRQTRAFETVTRRRGYPPTRRRFLAICVRCISI